MSPYKAIAQLDARQLGAQGEYRELTLGMQVVAKIHQGERTVIEYLLSPVKGIFKEAGRER